MIVIAIMAKANREASVRLPVSPPAVESARYPDLEVFSGTLVLDISAQATSESMATRRNILNPAWISSLPESALLRHRLCRLQRALKQILHRLIHARHLPFVKQSCCFYYSAFRGPSHTCVRMLCRGASAGATSAIRGQGPKECPTAPCHHTTRERALRHVEFPEPAFLRTAGRNRHAAVD